MEGGGVGVGVGVVVADFGDVVDVTDVVNSQAAGVVGLIDVVANHHRVVVDGGQAVGEGGDVAGSAQVLHV